MLIADIINKKRQGLTVSVKEINRFIQGVSDFSISDGEIASFAMASAINGLSVEETTNLTAEIIKSGIILNWDELAHDIPVTDVYSTLSVGNKLNIILPPILASCGCFVPKIGEKNSVEYSGFGTLDKIISIRGYNISPSLYYLWKVMEKTRCGIIGPNEELVPVERRFQIIRCLTSVNTTPAFTAASMLSRSICSGIKSLIVNINVGLGSLYQNMDEANKVAECILAVAKNFNLPVSIIFTNANYILGRNVGNALEVKEIIEYFKSCPENRNQTIHKCVLEIASECLILNKVVKNKEEAYQKIESSLISGIALDIFATMIYKLGGPADFEDYPEAYLAESNFKHEIIAEKEGFVHEVSPFIIGQAVRKLNHNRTNHGVGFSDIIEVGKKIEKGDLLAVIHADNQSDIKIAQSEFMSALRLDDKKPMLNDLIVSSARYGNDQ